MASLGSARRLRSDAQICQYLLSGRAGCAGPVGAWEAAQPGRAEIVVSHSRSGPVLSRLLSDRCAVLLPAEGRWQTLARLYVERMLAYAGAERISEWTFGFILFFMGVVTGEDARDVSLRPRDPGVDVPGIFSRRKNVPK